MGRAGCLGPYPCGVRAGRRVPLLRQVVLPARHATVAAVVLGSRRTTPSVAVRPLRVRTLVGLPGLPCRGRAAAVNGRPAFKPSLGGAIGLGAAVLLLVPPAAFRLVVVVAVLGVVVVVKGLGVRSRGLHIVLLCCQAVPPRIIPGGPILGELQGASLEGGVAARVTREAPMGGGPVSTAGCSGSGVAGRSGSGRVPPAWLHMAGAVRVLPRGRVALCAGCSAGSLCHHPCNQRRWPPLRRCPSRPPAEATVGPGPCVLVAGGPAMGKAMLQLRCQTRLVAVLAGPPLLLPPLLRLLLLALGRLARTPAIVRLGLRHAAVVGRSLVVWPAKL